ncbi:MAG: hypothetical protein WC661_13465 [Opitutaceae bacterium]|jgi:hypothetical protein
MTVLDSVRYRAEVTEIARYYADIRQPLSFRFLDAVADARNRAIIAPLAHRERKDGARVVLLRRFPYRLRFWLSEDRRILRVLSLTHTARKPE